MKYTRCFLHVDMDAFFASVEQHDHPEWKGKPVIVGGLPGEKRSVVSTASYEARKYGVHSAMPISKAVQLCPNGIYTHGNHSRYSEVSMQIMEILSRYSPDVHQISIDEASVEMTGTEMLFGEPDKVALQIQQEIFQKTGLTVSVGLASSAYLAKIASEVNKPNGFYAIPEGKEEDFMLSLPLKDVWGIGGKTLEKLNRKSFYTTKDIHQHSLESLEALFGKNFGTFLYNIVRGIQTESTTPSSHSISNETTFPEDVSDTYTAETVLLELCHSVMFRILRAKSYSRTVMIKIRYDDFSTFTVQQTFEDFITTEDDLFDKAKKLFEKKYEFGRGIRLIGVGLENIQDETAPRQGVLFDFGSEKKKAVENAILKLETKHPEIQIKKARLLENKIKLIAMLLVSGILLSRNSLTAEEQIETVVSQSAGTITSPMVLLPMPVEAPETIFDYTIRDKEIQFLAQGWWQGEMESTVNATWTKENGFNSSTPDIVFKQQVDLMLRFMLNRQWYFEAAFADEFNRNTITAGFFGKETNPLKEIRISNRNIAIPEGYSIDLFNRGIGGGENQAPGILASFRDPKKGKWTGDFAFRYDMTEQYDATWYGKNSVTTETIPLSSYMTGQLFTLPQFLIDKIKDIYVEKSDGEQRDTQGRKFRKLSEDEFLTVTSKNMLLISKDAGVQKKNGKRPVILVTFYVTEPELYLGDYKDSTEGENISFLREVQRHFGDEIELEKFTWKLVSEISGSNALVLQGPSGFTPFAFANFYDLGITSNPKVLVGNRNSMEASDILHGEISEEFESFFSSSFMNEKHCYAEVFSDESGFSFWSPEARFPAAKTLPGQYLGSQESTELSLLVQKYTPVSCYSIGTEASAGSVKVYINGIPDNSAKYDSESGTVTIESTVTDLDKVYITWNQDSGDSASGAIASQASFRYKFTEKLSADASFSALWTVSPFSEYSEYNRSSSGQLTLETGINYSGENLRLSNSMASTYEKLDVTDRYRIDGFEDATSRTNYLQKEGGHSLPENQLPVLNPRPESSDESIYLERKLDFTVTESTGTGTKDSFISGYKLPLEWVFSGTEKNSWAALNISLPKGVSLASASQFRLALQAAAEIPETVDIYLQLGIDSSESLENPEESTKIPTWKLTSLSQDLSQTNVSIPFNREFFQGSLPEKNGWQYIQVDITDSDRAFLSAYNGARLIIVDSNPSASNSSGILFAGPWEIVTNGMNLKADSRMNALAEQIKDNSIPSKNTWNTDQNYIQKISWNQDETELEKDEKNISTSKFFQETDISKYRMLNFFYNNADFSEFKIILDRNSSSMDSLGNAAVYAKLSETALSFINRTDSLWHIFSIDLLEEKLLVDGMELPESSYQLFIDRSVQPTRLKIEFTPSKKKDFFKLDELVMEESSSSFILQDIGELHFEKKGVLAYIKDFPVLEDPVFTSKNDLGTSIPVEKEFSGTSYISSTNTASITLAGIKISGTAQLSSKEEKLVSSASQNISILRPVFGILSAKDSFVFHHSDSSIRKESQAEISLNRFNVPLVFTASAQGEKSRWNSTGAISGQAAFNLSKDQFSFRGRASISASQKTPSTEETKDQIKEMNYGNAYRESTEYSFDFIADEAESRIIRQLASFGFSTPWIGFAPDFSFTQSQRYTNTSFAKYTDSTTLDFLFPFKLKKQSVSLRYTKTGGGTEETSSGGCYRKDLEELYDECSSRDWYFKTPPFYDLFAPDFATLMESSSNDSAVHSMTYSGKYSFNWKRGIFADKRDIFIPANFDFSAERSISKAADSTDNYILKAGIINTPMNLFGKQSQNPVFSWYDTDEFALSLSGTVKIPESAPQDALWSLNFYAQTGFYMNEKDMLKAGIQTSVETDNSWTAKASGQYIRKTNKSPIISIAGFFCKKELSTLQLTRTDSIDIGFSHSDNSSLTQVYDFTHKIAAEMFRYFTITAGINLNLKITEELTTLGATGSLGGKLTF